MRHEHEKPRKDTEKALFDVLVPLLRLTEDEMTMLEEALEEYVLARAEWAAQDAMDRKFNEGDYRS